MRSDKKRAWQKYMYLRNLYQWVQQWRYFAPFQCEWENIFLHSTFKWNLLYSFAHHIHTAKRQRRLSTMHHQQFQMSHKFKSKHKHLFENMHRTNEKSHINYLSKRVNKIYIVCLCCAVLCCVFVHAMLFGFGYLFLFILFYHFLVTFWCVAFIFKSSSISVACYRDRKR